MSLELQKISKTIAGEVYIHETSLKFTEGVFNILLGKTLAGKTTLMRLISGLEKPDVGKIFFEEKEVTDVPVQKRNVAMVYQEFINFPHLTIFENIASPLRIKEMTENCIKDKVKKVADLLKLSPYFDKFPNELSGGQQQRTALARAIAKGAKLILLDEPLVNLDYKLREELREELPQILSESNSTVIYATTEPSEALLLGGYTAAMKEGKILHYGQSQTVYRNPIDINVAQIFSDPPMNTIKVTKKGMNFYLDNGFLFQISKYSSMSDSEYILGFRPHNLILDQLDSSVCFSGTVSLVEISGSETYIHIDFLQNQKLISQNFGVHNIDIGSELPFYVKISNCFLFDTKHGKLIQN